MQAHRAREVATLNRTDSRNKRGGVAAVRWRWTAADCRASTAQIALHRHAIKCLRVDSPQLPRRYTQSCSSPIHIRVWQALVRHGNKLNRTSDYLIILRARFSG